MDCLQVQCMLSAFLDGRIVESEKRLLEKHLKFCVECGARYASMGAIQTALRAVPVRKVDRHLSLSLRALGSREAARRRRQVDFRAKLHVPRLIEQQSVLRHCEHASVDRLVECHARRYRYRFSGEIK